MQLGTIAGITVDRKGRIYAVDSRTGSIHVFDSAGTPDHVCQTRPTDFREVVILPAITVDDPGDVYLELGDGVASPNDERQFAHFSADGNRLKDVALPARACFFQPGTANIVALRYEEVLLVDPSGKTLRTIRRRPDGNWLEHPHAVSLAADGSMAIVSRGEGAQL